MTTLFAYIDPSTGSMFLQVIVGFLLAITVVLRSYIVAAVQRIRRLFRRGNRSEETE